MRTMIDAYELRAAYELPAPVIETYRAHFATPRQSIDLEVDYEDSDTHIPSPTPSSARWERARNWSSEEY